MRVNYKYHSSITAKAEKILGVTFSGLDQSLNEFKYLSMIIVFNYLQKQCNKNCVNEIKFSFSG
jgi:hypothetical protein